MRLRRWAALALLSLAASAAAAQGLDKLVEEIRQGSREMAKINQEREARFLREKNRQAALLAEAERDRNAADARAKAAKARFDSAQTQIAALKQQLQTRIGDAGQMYAAISEAAGAFRGQAADSLVTAQFPDRLARLDALASARELPSVSEIEDLWFLYAQEIAEGGKVARFQAQVLDELGAPRTMEVTRVGLFAAMADGRYLAMQPENASLATLARQPGDYLGLIDDFVEAAGDATLRPILVDPSRGALLRISGERPTLRERVGQAGMLGYIIIAIGVVGALLALYQLFYLVMVSRGVHRQLRDIGTPRADNPLGRVLGCLRDDPLERDPEVLETRLSEAVLRETPRLERFQPLLRMIVAAGPLLGLLGTVVGMIMTFQVITEVGAGDPKVMAGGISHAMVATVLGLLIAIPLLFVNSFLGARSRALLQVLDEQAAGLLARHLEALHDRRAA